MRAALGLALIAGSALLGLLVLRGHTPFDATSASGGRVSTSGASSATPAYNVQNPLKTSQIQHFGGMP